MFSLGSHHLALYISQSVSQGEKDLIPGKVQTIESLYPRKYVLCSCQEQPSHHKSLTISPSYAWIMKVSFTKFISPNVS